MDSVFVESVGKMDKKQVYEYIVKLGHEAFFDDFGFEVFEECDVVEEIVRCKDCADCTEEGIYTPQYYCGSRHWNSGCCRTPTDPNGFCAWGKRKKNENQ